MIIVTYERGKDGVDRRLSSLKHKFNDIVVESIHRHLGKKYCVDIMIAEGPIKRARTLIGRIRGMHNIEHVRSIFIPL
jgi:CopG family nickel-responsive transcriptional regulator